jgi:tRNA(Ile)-lysidine synthase
VADEPFLGALREVLERWPGAHPERPLAVALSGGLDSTLLLTALCRLGYESRLRAIHVDHAIHPSSAEWERHCRALAGRLGVRYESRRVAVDVTSPAGLEAAAREARYGALREIVAAGELLMTAHHADDQLETVLLRLLRGTGARGLRGIAAFAPFGRGALGRPLLRFTRAQLAAVAVLWRLEWLEDPANRELRHDRNYLRTALLPPLRARWPAAAQTVGRLAELMTDAEDILESAAQQDSTAVADAQGRLSRAALAALPRSRQRNLVRYLLRRRSLPAPTAAQLDELLHAALAARADAQAVVRWPGAEARVYRGRIYLQAQLSPAERTRQLVAVRVEGWRGAEGDVRFTPTSGPGLPESWLDGGLTLRFRAGGERLRPAGRAHSAPLKAWFQEAGIVPWMRARIPLLFHGEHLAAVADIWLSAEAAAAPAERRWRVVWSAHPPVV